MFIDIARSRRSTRSFTGESLTDREKELILEAGGLAPSSRGIRPVRLFPVDDPETIRRLEGCKDSGGGALSTAVFAVVVAADSEASDVWIEDCSIASIMMQLEAEDLGLGSCWIQVRLRNLDGTPAADNVKRIASLDGDLEVLSVIAFGRKARSGGQLQRLYSDLSTPI